jgi:hypothetical protein
MIPSKIESSNRNSLKLKKKDTEKNLKSIFAMKNSLRKSDKFWED